MAAERSSKDLSAFPRVDSEKRRQRGYRLKQIRFVHSVLWIIVLMLFLTSRDGRLCKSYAMERLSGREPEKR